MCGRYTIARIDRLIAAFPAYRFPADALPRYNIAPTQPVLALRNDGSDAVEWLRWGLMPPWSRTSERRGATINARLETLAERMTWRRQLQTRRCAIFADGFYEWRPEGAAKTPVYVQLEGARPFAFAGLWDRSFPHGAPPIDRCAIVTGPPNAAMAAIHDRMPLILPRDAFERWLDPRLTDVAELLALLVSAPSAALQMHDVSRRVNSVANDGPELILPAG